VNVPLRRAGAAGSARQGNGQLSPTVSAILLCYNCEDYIAPALRSVLAQEYPAPIDVIVSDDASTDRTLEIVRETIGATKTPHSVRVIRQPSNSGSKSAHLNRVWSVARGDILISFDGDDISTPWRTGAIVQRFQLDPEVHAVYSEFSLMDAAGSPIGRGRVPHPGPQQDSLEWFARVDAYAAGGTLAIRKRVFELFGPLDPDIHEDIVLPFRASLLGGTAFIAEPLVTARRHAQSFTADMDRFASLAAYRARMLKGIARARRNRESRLSDIGHVQALMPERSAEFERLRAIVEQTMALAELSGELLGPSRRERVVALLRLVRAGAYREHLAQHAALVVMPELYLRYKRRRFR
jgi:GT2 family glycosyltransferase